MALPGGMPPGMGMGGANAGMSEQERQMVKYVRVPTPNPKSKPATMQKWILRNEPTLTLLLPTDANGHGKLRRQDHHVRRHGRWLGRHVRAVHEQRKPCSSSPLPPDQIFL